MSGTSLDGVDVALIETDGERVSPRSVRRAIVAYPDEERALLRQALAEARSLTDRDARPGVVGEAERAGDHAACRGGRRVSAPHNGIAPTASTSSAFTARPCCTGPSDKLTIQIGDGAALAESHRHSGGATISARPMSRPAGRARRWCRSITARWPPVAGRGRIRSRCSISAASPTSPIIDGDRRPDRLRHRAGQCADRRLHAARARASARREGRAAAQGASMTAAIARAAGAFRSLRCSRRNRSTATISRVARLACATCTPATAPRR